MSDLLVRRLHSSREDTQPRQFDRNFNSYSRNKLSIQNMSKILKIGFIGGGKMAQAMAKGFVSAGSVVILFKVV